MPKKVAILQSNYIPWKGYFDIINTVDEFILYDDVQYTKNDWRNRNKIKTAQGVQWLTIPVQQNSLNQKIIDTKIADKKWNIKHWRTVSQNYSKTKYFQEYKNIFEELYLTCDEEYLSQINYRFIKTINNILGIKTKIRWSNEFKLGEGQTKRLIDICMQCNAEIYVSGPSAQSYFDEELAKKVNLDVQWMNYNGYLEYEQMFPPFEHAVSIIDLIFNQGIHALDFLEKRK